MVFHPEKWFKKCKKKGFKKVIFHIEAVQNPEKIIHLAKKLKLEFYIAINPSTPLKKIKKIDKNVLVEVDWEINKKQSINFSK